MINNLKSKYDNKIITNSLSKLNISLMIRSEELSPEQLFNLFSEIEKQNG